MTISDELAAKILRFHFAEKWKVGTIAHQLGIHHSVVKRVLSQSGVTKTNMAIRISKIDPYLPFILETLKKYPTLTAIRLYHMVRERGFTGGPDFFRKYIAKIRPKPAAEAYLRLRTLPGEQGQVDWGHFGHIIIGKAKRPLMAFVMVLSYSRKIFLEFFLNHQMSNFIRGHEAAFNAWQGVPRVLLYDNLKSAVLERQGDAIRFHPTLLSLSAHYHFEPRPVAVARGNEKGRVERAIRYVRDNFFSAREFKDLDDLNEQATAWCEGQASDRPCPEDSTISVRDVFLKEKESLLALPDNPFPAVESLDVTVGKTPYVRFDLNDYSIPHTHVRRILTVHAEQDKISILDGADVIARHDRSYDKGKQIEDESHIKTLKETKKHAKQHTGQNRLAHTCPSSMEFLNQAASRGHPLKTIVSSLLELLDSYGSTELEAAIAEAIKRDVPHPNSVRLCLEKRRELRRQPPPIHLDLPKDKRVRELTVPAPNLKDYDKLQG